MRSRVLEYSCRLVAADLAFARGHEGAGLQELRKALALARTGRFCVFPWIRRDAFARLLERAIREEIEPGEVRRLVGQAHLLPPSRTVPVAVWPRPVEVLALGRFELRKEGRRLEFGRKAQKKPLELVKVLVSFGAVDVAAERVADVLWPDLDGHAARQALATTLHRLRQLVECEEAIVLHDGRLSLDPMRCWVDAIAFEELLAEAERLQRDEGDTSPRALAAVEQAVALYRGGLLEGDADAPWALSASERLRSKFLRHVLRTGEMRESAGAPERAIEIYLRGLEVDDLAEEFYLRLMRCYGRVGRRAEALAAYE
ncbi:MAG: AfsR/SARP family transcriptional regulator, partial [Myxococcota bacterium]